MVDIPTLNINPVPSNTPGLGQINRTRGLADLLTQQGLQAQPIHHPLQGLGQLAQTAAGVFLSNKADRQARERREAGQSALLNLVGGAGGGAGSPSLQALLGFSQQFPEQSPLINPLIAAQLTPSKPLVLGEGDTAFDPRTREVIATGPEKAPKFQTDFGKAVSDARIAEATFGKDSPQASAFRELAQAERTGGGVDLTDEGGQRKEFTKASGDFIKVRDAFGKIQKAKGTAAGDLALIFNYMKLLDPGSVVREGEFATAQNTAGVPERIRNVYNRALSGVRLSPEQRTNFKDQAADVFTAQREQQNLLESEFGRIAESSGLRPGNVIVDFQGDFRNFTIPGSSAQPAQPATPQITPEGGSAPLVGSVGATGAQVPESNPNADLLNADLPSMTPEERRAWLDELNRRGF